MKKKKSIIKLFTILDYNIDSLEELENITLNHKTLQSPELINEFYKLIPELRKIYDSHYLTCLHKNSLEKQKFPVINMLRQLLKCNNYKLKPKIVIHGYNPITKAKIIERFFTINKINTHPKSLVEHSGVIQ